MVNGLLFVQAVEVRGKRLAQLGTALPSGQHQAPAALLLLHAVALRGLPGLLVGRVGDRVSRSPMSTVAGVPAGWFLFQGSVTPRGLTERPLAGGWDWAAGAGRAQKEVSLRRSFVDCV